MQKKEEGKIDKRLKKYPKTALCQVVDTLPEKHGYMIGAKHVAHASDKFGGALSDESIRDGEKAGIMCAHCHGQMSYDEHKSVLLIAIDSPKELNELKDKIHPYLLKIKPMAEEDGYAGFAFMQRKEWLRVRSNNN